MAASKDDINGWFQNGVDMHATHMIVVCDTFDHEDYPVFAHTPEECLIEYDKHDDKNMQRIMEVYDLQMDKAEQMAEHRAFHLPSRT